MSDKTEKTGKTSKGSTAAIVIVILAILFLVAYKLSNPTRHPANKDQNAQQQETVTTPTAAVTDTISEKDTEKATSNTANSNQSITDDTRQSIKDFLKSWKIGWQKSAGEKGNLKRYFSFYATDFKTPKLDRKAWHKSKTIRNRGKSWIEVWLTNIVISKTKDNNFVVKFKQEYSSSNYSDKSTKRLLLKKAADSWKIISEETVGK